MLDRQKLAAYAKKNSGPSSAASLLKKKREEAAALNSEGATTGSAAAIDNKLGMADPTTPAGAPAAEEPTMINDLVFEAEDAAINGSDPELEDAIASAPMDLSQPPPWAQDPEKWHEAAEAVGLDVPGIEDKFEEPFVVTAYLYKMIGGSIAGDVSGIPPAPGAEQLGEGELEA